MGARSMGLNGKAKFSLGDDCSEDTATIHTRTVKHVNSPSSSTTAGVSTSDELTSPSPSDTSINRRKPIRCKKGGPLVPYLSDSSRIRSNYLHRLGLETQKEQLAIKNGSNNSRQTADVCSTETLKKDYGMPDEALGETSPSSLPIKNSSSSSAKSSTPPRVSFHPSVTAHAIPSRKCYSKRVRNTIWMSQRECEVSIARNGIEYMSEGCEPDWVLEEEDFIWLNGELRHPFWTYKNF